MATYLVGDIQGCYHELLALLTQIEFNKAQDIIYFAGDLVARGENSLETLRFIKSLGNSAKIVLGNHDLHLLAIHAGIRKAKVSDKLDALINADDIDDLTNWLAQQPLIQKITCSVLTDNNKQKTMPNAYMSHAGMSPQWDLPTALEQAEQAHQKISSPERIEWLKLMYGAKPNSWFEASSDIDKFRYTINAFTRMRYCYVEDGALEFDQKDSPQEVEKDHKNSLTPWYTLSKCIENTEWVFGHWASLMGKTSHQNTYALDTGCVWGGHLTMLRWHDKKVFTQNKISL